MEISEKLYEPNENRTTRSATAGERMHIPSITLGLPTDHLGDRKSAKLYQEPVRPPEPYLCERPEFTQRTSPLAEY